MSDLYKRIESWLNTWALGKGTCAYGAFDDTFDDDAFIKDRDIVIEQWVNDRFAMLFEEWHEDDGNVLWWKFPIEEPPYCGTPLDANWPGYHTHYTTIPIPVGCS